MHEMSVARALLEQALTVAEAHRGLPIERVDVAIGALRQVDPELLAFAFNAATNGTAAEGAELKVEHVPLLIECRVCEEHYPALDPVWSCPACEAYGGRVIQGDELTLRSIELRTEDEARRS